MCLFVCLFVFLFFCSESIAVYIKCQMALRFSYISKVPYTSGRRKKVNEEKASLISCFLRSRVASRSRGSRETGGSRGAEGVRVEGRGIDGALHCTPLFIAHHCLEYFSLEKILFKHCIVKYFQALGICVALVRLISSAPWRVEKPNADDC